MPAKRVPWEKAKKFFSLLKKGKAPLEEAMPGKKGGRRGKGRFKDFWVKPPYKGKDWIATGRFNKVFRDMIKEGAIKPKHFELENIPRYFVERSSKQSVSHYIKGPILKENASAIAKAVKAPVEKVLELKYEVWPLLVEVLEKSEKRYPKIFQYFWATTLRNVIVKSYNPKTKKFKIAVIDV